MAVLTRRTTLTWPTRRCLKCNRRAWFKRVVVWTRRGKAGPIYMYRRHYYCLRCLWSLMR